MDALMKPVDVDESCEETEEEERMLMLKNMG